MHISISWTRTFTAESEGTIDVPDNLSREDVEKLVVAALSNSELEIPTSANAAWDGSGFVTWCESDKDGDDVEGGLTGEFDE